MGFPTDRMTQRYTDEDGQDWVKIVTYSNSSDKNNFDIDITWKKVPDTIEPSDIYYSPKSRTITAYAEYYTRCGHRVKHCDGECE